MAEGGALGVPGGSRRVLDVDGVVVVQAGRPLGEGPVHAVVGLLHQGVPLGGFQEDHVLEVLQFVPNLGDHRPVVGGQVLLRRHQYPAPGLRQCVADLVGPVGGIDVDQDHPHLGGGVLEPHPLRAVRTPDPQPVAHLQPKAEQSHCEQVDRLVELPVGLADPLVHRHKGVAVGIPGDHRLEVSTDGLLQQWCRPVADGVGRSGHDVPPDRSTLWALYQSRSGVMAAGRSIWPLAPVTGEIRKFPGRGWCSAPIGERSGGVGEVCMVRILGGFLDCRERPNLGWSAHGETFAIEQRTR